MVGQGYGTIFPAASRLDDGYDKGYRTAEVAKKGESAYLRASDLRCGVLGPPQANVPASNPMNTFRWAKSTLMQRAPTAFADVQRYEAESKFFRSLTIALPIVGLLTAGRLFAGPMTEPARDAASPCAIAVLVLIATGTLMYLSYLRYAEQRFKSTEWAYVHVIILLSGPLPAPSKTSGE